MNVIERGILCLLAGGLVVLSCTLAQAPSVKPDLGERLDLEMKQVKERMDAKGAILRKLLAGKLSLCGAAARFREVDTIMPRSVRLALRWAYPSDTDQERYCWVVLNYLAELLHDDPERARAVRSRLDPEVPENLRLRLPLPGRSRCRIPVNRSWQRACGKIR